MDHIPMPANPCSVPIEVPHLAQKYPELRYPPPAGRVVPVRIQGENFSPEMEKFLAFPETARFDTYDIADGVFGDRTLEDVLCFIQSWCFFGLLISVMGLSGVEVRYEDLIRARETSGVADSTEHSEIISTGIFPRLLRDMETHSRPGTVDEETIQTVYNECLICLRRVMIFMRDINLSRDKNNPLRAALEPKSATPSLRDRIILSVFALGDFLHYALMLWLPQDVPPTEPEWGTLRYVPFLKERLLNAGWCRSEANLLDDQPTGLSSLYYLSFIDRRPLGKDHRACPDSFNCKYEKLDEYKTLHCDDCPGKRFCKDVDVSQFQGPSVQQIVREDNIPVVTLEVERNLPAFEKSSALVPAQSMLPGIQNVLRGRLTSVSTSSTNSSDQKAASQYVAFSHVWQDGLGNRDANALPSCQLLRLQSLANDLYGNPNQPIPFWLDTLCVPLEEEYKRRAIGNMFNVYQQAEYVLVLDSTILSNQVETTDPFQLLISVRTSNWVRRLWTFQEGAIARSLQFQFADTALTLGDIVDAVIEASRNQDDDLKGLGYEFNRNENSDERLIAASNLIWPAWNYLQQIQDVDFTPGSPKRKLEEISMPLCWRNTSRPTDEPICLSSLLRLDQSVRKAIASSPGDQRIQMLLQEIGELPSDILFVNRPHFTEDGSRWIPQSFLGGGRQATLFAPSSSARASATAKILKSGLLVSLPGYLLEGSVNYDDMFFAMGDGFGIVVMAAPDASFDLDDFFKKKLAVILKEDLSSKFAELLMEDIAPGCMGVLVSMVEPVVESKPAVVRYEQLVKVFLAQSPPFGREQGNMCLKIVTHDQEWVVR